MLDKHLQLNAQTTTNTHVSTQTPVQLHPGGEQDTAHNYDQRQVSTLSQTPLFYFPAKF